MGKVALVTGGTRGIGAAIGKALQSAGYTVAASYAGNDEKANAFKDETGIGVYKWDVSDGQSCAEGLVRQNLLYSFNSDDRLGHRRIARRGNDGGEPANNEWH